MTAISKVPMQRNAAISDDGRYRYSLSRYWADDAHRIDLKARRVLFVMLNPSRADGREDDPTIRRCIRYARDWGFDALDVANLYAYRATNPTDLELVADPVGPDNAAYLGRLAATAELIVCAWGAYAGPDKTRPDVARLFLEGLARQPLHVIKVTKFGHPAHPLYLKAEYLPRPWGRTP